MEKSGHIKPEQTQTNQTASEKPKSNLQQGIEILLKFGFKQGHRKGSIVFVPAPKKDNR